MAESSHGALAALSVVPTLSDRARGDGGALALREGTAEMHFFVAERALGDREGDLVHGLSHLAALLALDPSREDWLRLLDDAAARHDDILTLLAPSDTEAPAITALRGWLSVDAGHLADGVGLLVAASRPHPEARYLEAWALPALRAMGPDALDLATWTELFACVVDGYPERAHLTVRQLDAVRSFARLGVEVVAVARANGSGSTRLEMFVAGACRRAGDFEQGLALLEAAAPSWPALAARGLLLRQLGRIDEAVAAFAAGGTHVPDDRTWRLEAGDALFEARRYLEAEAHYRAVLEREPEHEWAAPSREACLWWASGAPTDDVPSALSRWLPRSARARALLAARRGPSFDPGDASLGVLEQVLGDFPPGSAELAADRPPIVLNAEIDHVEAPSNHRLVALIYGERLRIEMAYGTIATPDPRAPIAHVETEIWRRAGEHLVVALPPPPAALVGMIAELARELDDETRAWAAASHIANTLDDADLSALLACIVHPPPLVAGTSMFDWIPRVQLATAFVIAQVGADRPWDGSPRRAALRSILHGPMDWSVSGAIAALHRLVMHEPSAALDAHQALATLLEGRPDRGHAPWWPTLLDRWPAIPGLFPTELEQLRALRRIEERP